MSLIEDPEVFRTVLEGMQTGVYLVDLDQKILFWNDGAEKITGYFRQDVVGHFCRDNLLAQVDVYNPVISDAAEAILAVLRDGKPTIAEVSLRHKSGHRVFVRLRGIPIRNAHGTIIGAAESFDESPSAAACDRRNDKLANYGCLDSETDVLMQWLIHSHLREMLATYAEHPVPFSILLIEIDRLDHFRSAYGKGVMPAILRIVAQTLENSLRPTDFLGRHTPNQFLAVLTECTGSEVGLAANRLKKMVGASTVKWWGDEIPVTASFGATCAITGDTSESILGRAERALQIGIAAGGDSVTVRLE